LRYVEDDQDAYLAAAITAARTLAEEYTRLRLITQSITVWLDAWPMGRAKTWWDGPRSGPMSMFDEPGDNVELPAAPVQSITSVTTYDDADAATVWPDTEYRLQGGEWSSLRLKSGATWPTATRNGDAIEIELVAGYGDTGNAVPAAIRHALLLMVAHAWENRGDIGANMLAGSGARAVLAPFRKEAL
jgi:hypothetical protein